MRTRDAIQRRRPVQGNLDRGVDGILSALAGGPLIYNLGLGILPDTSVAHVEQMLKRVRG